MFLHFFLYNKMPNANDACDADSSKNVDFLDEFLPFFYPIKAFSWELFLSWCEGP